MRILGLCALVCGPLAFASGCVADVVGSSRTAPEQEEDGAGSNDSQSSITPTRYLEEIAKIQCEQAYSCRDTYPFDDASFQRIWNTSVAACTTSVLASWNTGSIETEIAKGQIEFDGTAAVACLSGVAFGSCTEHWQRGIQWAEACYHVLVGSVPAGGSCESSYACLSFQCDLAARRCL
jgi:hypothetical protein